MIIIKLHYYAERYRSSDRNYDFSVFYAFSIATFVAPGDFPSYVEFIKNLQLPMALLFPAKTVMAFPLVYHYINGIRHLVSGSAL